MTILYRGNVSGQYVYWNSNQVTPSGVSDTIIINNNIVPQLKTRPPVDANHTHIWYMGEGCTTNGTDIIADVGGLNLTRFQGSGNVTTGYGIFTTQQSALLSGSALGLTGFAGNISIATTSSVSFECIARIPSWGANLDTIGTASAYQPFVQLTSNSAPYNQINFNYIWGSNAFTFGSVVNGNYSIDYPSINYGASNDNTVTPDIPHHLMTTWDYASGIVKHYIDGEQYGNTVTWGAPRGAIMSSMQIYMSPNGFSLADVRISNVIRTQAYALAATNAMRAL